MASRRTRGARATLIPLCIAALGLLTEPSRGAADPGPAPVSLETALDDAEPRLAATLLVDPEAPGPGALRVGVLFEPDPGWHLYWRNPGETGLPTRIDFGLETAVGAPTDATAGPIAWPAPEAFSEDGLVTYGYGAPVLLTAELRDAPAGPARLRAEVDVLVCERQCIPARFTLARPLPGPAVGGEEAAAVRARFAAAREALPRGPEALGAQVEIVYGQSGIRPGDAFQAGLAVVPCAGAAGEAGCRALRPVEGPAAFAPEGVEDLELSVEGRADHPLGGRGFVIRLAGRAGPDAPERPGRLRGVLGVVDEAGRRGGLAVDLPLPLAPAGSPVAARELPWTPPGDPTGPEGSAGPGAGLAGLGLLGILGLALLGGLVLNLMPCVLPVLAIKVFAVAELAHKDPREVRLQGAAYAGGIGASMLALALGVTLLRALGRSVGWGFQFQEPLFLAAVAVVVMLFALNLLGVYEIAVDTGRLAGLGSQAVGLRRSFFEGLLAVVLATPCSAPFLGTAVGFAFAGSGALVIGVFLAIGAGLAAPFVLVTWVPGGARWIPRSGPWMLHVRAVLGFLLLATVIWLVWVLGRVADPGSLVLLLVVLWGLSFVAWLYGRLQQGGRAAAGRAVAAAAGLALLLGANTVSLEPAAAELESRPYAPERVAAWTAEGRPAFVYFTADWCLTCKANERLVLRDERVRETFARRGVGVFRADWTQRDDAIRAELARFGRAGVPLYVSYAGGGAEPEVLPELLTPDLVIEAFPSP